MIPTNRGLVVIALICATFLAAMEATAVATVMPTIVGDLGGIHLYAWVFTAYMMSSTVMVPIFGKLADTYGRKPMLQSGIFVFLLGSIGAAMSKQMTSLILFRAIQGLGAGAIQPVSITIIGDLYNVKERAKITGIFSAIWAVAGISGPLLGGLIVEYFSWHWIFWINLPLGILSIAILQASLRENLKKEEVNLDIAGAVFLSLAVGTLLVGVNQPTQSSWLLPLAGGFLLLLFITERSSIDPLFPPVLFSKRAIASANIISGLCGGVMLAMVTYLPLYIQGALRMSGSQSAAAIIPMAFGWPAASMFMARYMIKIGYRVAILIGLCFIVFAMGIIALSAWNAWPVSYLMVGMLFLGLGMGASNIPILISVQTSVEWKQRGIATAGILFFRTIGGTVSVGFLGGILAATLMSHPEIPIDAASKLLSSEHGASLSEELRVQLAGVLTGGLQRIFWDGFFIACIALFAGFSFPEIPIQKNIEVDAKSEI